MLTCVYHPLQPMKVVEADEADKLKATGVWFDSPKKAAEYKQGVEQKVKKEKSKDKRNERQKQS